MFEYNVNYVTPKTKNTYFLVRKPRIFGILTLVRLGPGIAVKAENSDRKVLGSIPARVEMFATVRHMVLV